MATGRRRGRVIIYIALILILLLVLLLVLTRPNFLGGGGPAVNNPGVSQATTPQVAPTQASEVVNIVVNTQDVARGKPLTEDLLALVAIPRADYTQGVFFTDKKEVVNSRAKYDLKAHTPLTNALVVTSDATGSVPAFEIPAGKVAITIPVGDKSSVSYGLQKGDHVNVIVSLQLVDLDTAFQTKLPNKTGVVIAPGPMGGTTNAQGQTQASAGTTVTASLTEPAGSSVMGRIELDPTLNNPVWLLPSEAQRPRLVSQTLIQDAIVLQMGDFGSQAVQQAAAPAPTQAPQPTQQAQPQPTPVVVLPKRATLIVSPQDAVTLNYLMLAGADLNMVMRSAGDTEIKDTEAVTLQFVLDQYRIPNPAKLPLGLEKIQDQGLSPSNQQAATPAP